LQHEHEGKPIRKRFSSITWRPRLHRRTKRRNWFASCNGFCSEATAGKMQPRQRFDSENMAHLIDSIRQKGVLQPILVRPLQEDTYEIIAGERRWRASKEAGLKEVPIIIVDCDDEEALEVGLIENLQRDDLNAIEEAESLKKLIDDFGKHKKKSRCLLAKPQLCR
jgi:ParB/RepB/Spo0J family partition protein